MKRSLIIGGLLLLLSDAGIALAQKYPHQRAFALESVHVRPSLA